MPKVTSIIMSTTKVSAKALKDKSYVDIKFDSPIQAYTVNCIGTSPTTGIVVQSYYKDVKTCRETNSVSALRQKKVRETRLFEADSSITIEIDDSELYQEGNNRINIYGKDLQGNWTPYDDV